MHKLSPENISVNGDSAQRARLGAGVSFKPDHLQAILQDSGQVGWFEVHPENYMVDGGVRLAQLREIRSRFPISLHGVGLSLGNGERPNAKHLNALRRLVDQFDPVPG